MTQTTQRPIERFLPLLNNYREYSKGYIAPCPAHADKHPSLMIWEDETDGHVGLKCFTGCTRAQICEALHITEHSLYTDGYRGTPRTTVTALDLAVDKLINPHLLYALGVKDDKRGVAIPYHNQDGTPYERYRIRTALIAKKGSEWNTDSKAPLIPYGLERLQKARDQGYLVLVEGESDCWTLWQHGIPALGIPGVENYKVLAADMLTDIPKVYIIAENDEKRAGEKFAANVEKHLKRSGYQGKLYRVEMGSAKDPNDLQKKDIKAFKTAFQTLLDRAIPLFPIGKKPTIGRICDLQKVQFPPIRWAIPDLVPEGLTLLGGKPKLGKSWLLLALLIAVASGASALGCIDVEQGEVLYISMEDKEKRLRNRVNKVNDNRAVSENFHYATSWPRLNEGGLEYLEEWIQEHPRVRLIGIDTWAKIKPRSRRNGQQYEEDYEALAPLQELAAKYAVPIIVVHHMRKEEAEDPVDMILGSTANAGAVDGFLLLYRKRGETDARLYVDGRDIEEEQELILSFNRECATWTIKRDTADKTVASTPERQEVLDILLAAKQPMTIREVASKLPNKSLHTLRYLMSVLRKEERVVLENNMYSPVRTITPVSPITPISPVSSPCEPNRGTNMPPINPYQGEVPIDQPVELDDSNQPPTIIGANRANRGIVQRECKYPLHVAGDASLHLVNRFAEARRVRTCLGDGWVTEIRSGDIGVILDGDLSHTDFLVFQVTHDFSQPLR